MQTFSEKREREGNFGFDTDEIAGKIPGFEVPTKKEFEEICFFQFVKNTFHGIRKAEK